MNSGPSDHVAAAIGDPSIVRVRHESRRRKLVVQRVETLSQKMLRVILGGDELEGFTSLGFDDHVKLIFDPTGPDQPPMRDFTPRRFDPSAHELAIDFAIHEVGVATNWAASAAPGQALSVGGPRGCFIIPKDIGCHLSDWRRVGAAGDRAPAPKKASRGNASNRDCRNRLRSRTAGFHEQRDGSRPSMGLSQRCGCRHIRRHFRNFADGYAPYIGRLRLGGGRIQGGTRYSTAPFNRTASGQTLGQGGGLLATHGSVGAHEKITD